MCDFSFCVCAPFHASSPGFNLCCPSVLCLWVSRPGQEHLSHVAWGQLAGNEWVKWTCVWTEKPDHSGQEWAKADGLQPVWGSTRKFGSTCVRKEKERCVHVYVCRLSLLSYRWFKSKRPYQIICHSFRSCYCQSFPLEDFIIQRNMPVVLHILVHFNFACLILTSNLLLLLLSTL